MKDWIEVRRTFEWNYGYADPKYGPLENEVMYHSVTTHIPGTQDFRNFKRQKGKAKLDCGDRIIIGVRVKSVRETYLDGWWRLEYGHIQDGIIEVSFKTRSHEPRDWTLEC